ncbi:uncharacterized protein TRUGW13939_10309 [Talaromyces rugulosus]|uniref:EthD domain-containing protein n=1 Tax=Talaromyces rugulosus TaxID=121627 RepID=A0A7H8R9Q4_TALRU|nr:uncharacterized protein TRUGW13939_10309 [Talaromyces rugulosus]QKX63140.1 hypothetical protein TRUGW13939_10309 [Talaromyces rugulosus]
MSSTARLLRLSIKLYKSAAFTDVQCHEFARGYIAKAAKIHAKHGITSYQLNYSPAPYRGFVAEMNKRNNRGWVIDDHDITVEFYYRNFAELNKVNGDPEFQALQASEEPYVNRENTVVSLAWVEKYVDEAQVVNIVDEKSSYGPWAELVDLSTALPDEVKAAWSKGGQQ